MGKTNYTQDELVIIANVDKLIEKLRWYSEYLTKDFELPRDIEGFSARNIEIMNSISTLDENIANIKACSRTGNFSLSRREKEFKAMQLAFIMRYIGLY